MFRSNKAPIGTGPKSLDDDQLLREAVRKVAIAVIVLANLSRIEADAPEARFARTAYEAVDFRLGRLRAVMPCFSRHLGPGPRI